MFLQPGRALVSRCATGQGVSVPLCNRAKCYPVAQPDANVSGLRIGTPRCATGCPVAQPGRLGIGTEHIYSPRVLISWCVRV